MVLYIQHGYLGPPPPHAYPSGPANGPPQADQRPAHLTKLEALPNMRRLLNSLVGCLVGWLFGWLVGWLVSWLVS